MEASDRTACEAKANFPFRRIFSGILALFFCVSVSGCSFFDEHISTRPKFSSAKYGAKSSPRVTTAREVPKGGGSYKVGKPYRIAGRKYVPSENPEYLEIGTASWYGPNFHGRLTANGEIYDQYHLSAAHRTLPLPSYARVTNMENGRSVIVRINDRGPFSGDRIIDLSHKSAEVLGFRQKGTAPVRVQYVGKAPLSGNDMKYLTASYRRDSPLDDPSKAAPSPENLLALAGEIESLRKRAAANEPSPPISGSPPASASFAIPLPAPVPVLIPVPVPAPRF